MKQKPPPRPRPPRPPRRRLITVRVELYPPEGRTIRTFRAPTYREALSMMLGPIPQ